MVLWFELRAVRAESLHWVPRPGTKIPQGARCGQKKIKESNRPRSQPCPGLARTRFLAPGPEVLSALSAASSCSGHAQEPCLLWEA